MKQYLDLLRTILDTGVHRPSRGVVNGAPSTGTRSVFGHQMRFNLADGFPLLTTKRVHMRSIVHELLWFIRGDTNIRYLVENKVTIWDSWASADGELGPVYGAQWRRWGRKVVDDLRVIDTENAERFEREVDPGIDQLAQLIDGLKKNPFGRRHILSAWNVADVDKMALPPCHMLSQFYVADGKLSCMLIQRSGDIFLGIPFNIASYALLTHMIAEVVGLDVGELVHVIGDAHLYDNHEAAALEQLTRTPGRPPRLVLEHRDNIDDFVFADVTVVDYDPAPAIRADVVV